MMPIYLSLCCRLNSTEGFIKIILTPTIAVTFQMKYKQFSYHDFNSKFLMAIISITLMRCCQKHQEPCKQSLGINFLSSNLVLFELNYSGMNMSVCFEILVTRTSIQTQFEQCISITGVPWLRSVSESQRSRLQEQRSTVMEPVERNNVCHL